MHQVCLQQKTIGDEVRRNEMLKSGSEGSKW